MTSYTAYGGFDAIDVSDLTAPAIIIGAAKSTASTVSGRLRDMFSAIPKSDTMGKLYFAGPTRVKKLSSLEEIQNAKRIAKMGAAMSQKEWYGSDEPIETNIAPVEPFEYEEEFEEEFEKGGTLDDL